MIYERKVKRYLFADKVHKKAVLFIKIYNFRHYR
ncbi:Uncharacterised protein [[Eubacterium] contortum]|uniref:Uncharacterized protein n=1 Tax=Faecalicatena contorta TaxID=39482 RepID=A0A174J0N4_9FIRM|nr:Uncharacterised protein [[Eubacterium] contortum] [Faecalicatena contorta]